MRYEMIGGDLLCPPGALGIISSVTVLSGRQAEQLKRSSSCSNSILEAAGRWPRGVPWRSEAGKTHYGRGYLRVYCRLGLRAKVEPEHLGGVSHRPAPTGRFPPHSSQRLCLGT